MRAVPDVVDLSSRRPRCPVHGIPDCSPLLNGCSYFSQRGVEDALEESVENHPSGSGVPAERRALLDAQKWSNRMVVARDGYAEALAECRRQGLSNSEIARAVGKSETAIRMHFRRREAPSPVERDPMQMTIDDMEL